MFEVIGYSKLPWEIISFKQDRPFLMVSLSASSLEDQSTCYNTFLLYSLTQLLELCDEMECDIANVQLLEPSECLGGNWQIHEIVNIRIIQVQDALSDAGKEIRHREEYHSADGRCFTFSELSDDDPVCESNFHSVYSVANSNPSPF